MSAKIVTITSGKGGVGKTTAVANIAVALASNGAKVCCIDGDIGLRNLDVVMGLENRIVYDLVDVIEGRCRLRQAMIRDKRLPELYLIPAAQTRDKSAVSPSDMVRLGDELRNEVDWVLIDSPAGIERGFKYAIAAADQVLVITNPEVSAVRDADRVIGLLEAEEKGSPSLIINRLNPSMVKNHDMLTAEDVIDFSSADYVSEMVISADGDFIVPPSSSGDWYFFIFFEPMNSPEESTWITFDVTYQTGLTPNDRWMNFLPILIIVAVIIIGIIIIAAVARRGQKRMATKEGVKSEELVGPQKETKPKKETPKEVAPVSNRICHRCGSEVKPDALFCPSCGGKLEGRQVVTSPKNTPVASKNCTFCGSKISVSDNYCKWCGTKIEK